MKWGQKTGKVKKIYDFCCLIIPIRKAFLSMREHPKHSRKKIQASCKKSIPYHLVICFCMWQFRLFFLRICLYHLTFFFVLVSHSKSIKFVQNHFSQYYMTTKLFSKKKMKKNELNLKILKRICFFYFFLDCILLKNIFCFQTKMKFDKTITNLQK